jgi:hypothetical protein
MKEPVIVFECKPTANNAIRHKWGEHQHRTNCGLVPTARQWDRGTFAYEHEMVGGEVLCPRCYYKPKRGKKR